MFNKHWVISSVALFPVLMFTKKSVSGSGSSSAPATMRLKGFNDRSICLTIVFKSSLSRLMRLGESLMSLDFSIPDLVEGRNQGGPASFRYTPA